MIACNGVGNPRLLTVERADQSDKPVRDDQTGLIDQ